MDATTAIGLFLLAFTVGTYGSVIGAGGGFLMVSGLVLIFDLGGATAVGTSVLTTLVIQATGAYTYTKKGLVDRPSALWFALGSIPVALLSAIFLADQLPEKTFELIIGVMLLVLAAFVIFMPSIDAPDGTTIEPHRGVLAASGGAVGILSGAFGVGAGLVTVPLLRTLQRLPAHRAAATTTLIGTLSGAAAALGHTLAGNPRWNHLPFLLAGAVIGGRVGSLNAGRLSGRTVLLLLAGGLIGAGIPLIISSL